VPASPTPACTGWPEPATRCSHKGVSTEEIARLVGHSSTRSAEFVYRRELRPVITTGAEIMDKAFKAS
jgi:hypothetical protein